MNPFDALFVCVEPLKQQQKNVFFLRPCGLKVSPGERHNYLAIRLSRYRQNDPFMAAPDESGGCGSPEVSDSLGIGEARWKGDAMPSLAPNADDTYEFEIPGYDMRKLIHARDPLCAANAFFIQIRGVVAPILGVRMCPECPHCNESSIPCQDALGSNAELMGGVAPPVILISPQIGKLKNVMLFDDVMLNIVGFCEVWNTNLRISSMHAVLVLFEGRIARNELLAF